MSANEGKDLLWFQKINDRTMKYPYTLTAQIRQFPYLWHFKNQWIYRYWCYATVLCIPVFYWISRKANSPANVQKYKEFKAKEAAEHHH